MTVLDYVAFFACLFGGIWLWRQLRGLGVGSLLAAAVTLVVLWIVAGLFAALLCALIQELSRLVGSAGGVLVGLAILGLLALVGFVGWWWWTNWRARQFFDL